MPKVTFEWSGVEELKKTLGAVGAALDDTDPRVKDVILVPSQAMRDRARGLIHSVTGNLAKSVYATKGGAKQRGILIGVATRKAPYARMVEHGTSKMAARPYFRPAMLTMFGTFVADVTPGMQKIVEDVTAANAYHAT